MRFWKRSNEPSPSELLRTEWQRRVAAAWPEVLFENDDEFWSYMGLAEELGAHNVARARDHGIEIFAARVMRDDRFHVATYEVAACRAAQPLAETAGPKKPPQPGAVVITARDGWLMAWRRPLADSVNGVGLDSAPPIDALLAEVALRGLDIREQ